MFAKSRLGSCPQLSSSHPSSISGWRKRLQFNSHRGSDQHTNTRPEACNWQQSMNGGSSCQSYMDKPRHLRNMATGCII
ncbi:hypothetical protein ACSS6W_006655 [Trichoderma asperelloides]